MPFPSHRFYEDVVALFCAGVFVSLGIVLFNQHGLLTGGTAGIAIVLSHLSEVNFGLLFFVVNLPFYWLAYTRLSKRFTLNTFLSVSMVSLMTEQMAQVISFNNVNPVFSAMVGGMLIGVGLIIMFRHKSSLGGLGILALYLQNRFGIRAGNVGLAADSLILTCSAMLFSIDVILLSIIGAVTLNLLIAINHKPGRYHASYNRSGALVKHRKLTESLVNVTK